jgi:hypothetical protein
MPYPPTSFSASEGPTHEFASGRRRGPHAIPPAIEGWRIVVLSRWRAREGRKLRTAKLPTIFNPDPHAFVTMGDYSGGALTPKDLAKRWKTTPGALLWLEIDLEMVWGVSWW